jgi:hypothetical protein
MKVALRTLITSERITRAKTAMAVTPVAMAAFVVLKPSALTMTIAKRKPGMASITSTTRPSTVSTHRSRKPERSPIRLPTRTPMATAISALVTDDAAPCTTRA